MEEWRFTADFWLSELSLCWYVVVTVVEPLVTGSKATALTSYRLHTRDPYEATPPPKESNVFPPVYTFHMFLPVTNIS